MLDLPGRKAAAEEAVPRRPFGPAERFVGSERRSHSSSHVSKALSGAPLGDLAHVSTGPVDGTSGGCSMVPHASYSVRA